MARRGRLEASNRRREMEEGKVGETVPCPLQKSHAATLMTLENNVVMESPFSEVQLKSSRKAFECLHRMGTRITKEREGGRMGMLWTPPLMVAASLFG